MTGTKWIRRKTHIKEYFKKFNKIKMQQKETNKRRILPNSMQQGPGIEDPTSEKIASVGSTYSANLIFSALSS